MDRFSDPADLGASRRDERSSSRPRRSSAMRRRVNSSMPTVSASFRCSRAMWSSNELSLVRLFVSSPRMV